MRATDAVQIARVLAACSAYGVPVVPRGAGSGQSGGALALAGGVILDMAGMDRIIRISRTDQTAVVQPGVVTADLQRAAAQKNLFYPPDPASVEFCTIGGNAAENAGGLRAVKYGVTRDYILALDAVLPSGKVMRTGSATMKGVVGYDLTRLLVGSEGTLAVITELTLRLLPLPEATATLSAVFEDLDHAAEAIAAVLAGGIRPGGPGVHGRGQFAGRAKLWWAGGRAWHPGHGFGGDRRPARGGPAARCRAPGDIAPNQGPGRAVGLWRPGQPGYLAGPQSHGPGHEATGQGQVQRGHRGAPWAKWPR